MKIDYAKAGLFVLGTLAAYYLQRKFGDRFERAIDNTLAGLRLVPEQRPVTAYDWLTGTTPYQRETINNRPAWERIGGQ